jgi:hypothetical protein
MARAAQKMADQAATNEAEALCAYLPALVCDGGVSDWERRFCASLIARRRRFPGRALSPRQVAALRRIVRSFQDRVMRELSEPGPSEGCRP